MNPTKQKQKSEIPSRFQNKQVFNSDTMESPLAKESILTYNFHDIDDEVVVEEPVSRILRNK